jgi:excisionase family DNA binding protein
MDNQAINQSTIPIEMPKKYDPLQLLTADEAAALLHNHRSTIYDMMQNGEIPTVKYGRSVRIRRQDLEQFIISHVENGG